MPKRTLRRLGSLHSNQRQPTSTLPLWKTNYDTSMIYAANLTVKEKGYQQLQSIVSDVESQLGGLGAPKLDIGSLTQADEFAEPVLKMRATKRELETKIRLAGKPPDESLIEGFEQGNRSLT